MNTMLFGADSDTLRPLFEQHPSLVVTDEAPDVVVCYGGDGTLLSAEQRWPSVPKVPIRNSLRGRRCIARPPDAVIERLAEGSLVRQEYMKLECSVRFNGTGKGPMTLSAMNEINVHMGHINSAVRVKLWLDDEEFLEGHEILGDGLVVSTPFGSTAYFMQITRGVFHAGLGIAFKNTTEMTTHVVVPETVTIRILITRGPAILAYDNAPAYVDLGEGDRLELRKHPRPAVLLTWQKMSHPADTF